jgi:hypothetical protein
MAYNYGAIFDQNVFHLICILRRIDNSMPASMWNVTVYGGWMSRFLYIFRTGQVCFLAFVTGTLFFRTRLHPTDVTQGNLYLAVLFFSLIHMMFNGDPQSSQVCFCYSAIALLRHSSV